MDIVGRTDDLTKLMDLHSFIARRSVNIDGMEKERCRSQQG